MVREYFMYRTITFFGVVFQRLPLYIVQLALPVFGRRRHNYLTTP